MSVLPSSQPAPQTFPKPPPNIWVAGVVTVGLLVFALAASMAIRAWDWDLTLARAWAEAPRRWFGDRSVACHFLNRFGAFPGIVLAVGALAVVPVAAWRPHLRRLVPAAVYVVVAFLLGPGLLVNGVLKHTWDRARPKDLIEFGRKERYEPVFSHVEGSRGRSFPSGHASAAFFLCSLGYAAAGWGTRRWMWTGLLLGTFWGALVAWSRMASGAHFLSDVLWSAALVNAVNFVVLLPFISRSTQPRTDMQRQSVELTA